MKGGIILKLFRFFRVFLLAIVILLAMGLSAAAMADNGNTSITFTPSFNSAGDLKVRIKWEAKTGPVYNSDTEIRLSYSGIPTSRFFPSSCAMRWNSSLDSSGTLTIKAQYLYPGSLTIRGTINDTYGEVTVEIPGNEDEMPSAPVLTADRTDVLITEEYTLYGEIEKLINGANDFILIRSGPGGSISACDWADRTETSRIFQQMIDGFPDGYARNDAAYTYELRYKDKTTGKWSLFSEPETVTVHRLGVFPATDYELPDEIRVGQPFDFQISSPTEGAYYELFLFENYVTFERINASRWHMTPVSGGTVSGMIDVTKPGYEQVTTLFSFEITDPSSGSTPEPPPDPIPEPPSYDLSKAVQIIEGDYSENTVMQDGIYLYRITAPDNGIYTIESTGYKGSFCLYDSGMSYLTGITTGDNTPCSLVWEMKAGETFYFTSSIQSQFILERKGVICSMDAPEWVAAGSSCTVTMQVKANNPIHLQWSINGIESDDYDDSETLELINIQQTAYIVCEITEENNPGMMISSQVNIEVYPTVNLYSGQTAMIPAPDDMSGILGVYPDDEKVVKCYHNRITGSRPGLTRVRIYCSIAAYEGQMDKYIMVHVYPVSQVIRLPKKLTEIGTEAFRNIRDVLFLEIPVRLQGFPDSAFDKMKHLCQIAILNENYVPDSTLFSEAAPTILCYQGSRAETYARENGLQFLYMYGP